MRRKTKDVKWRRRRHREKEPRAAAARRSSCAPFSSISQRVRNCARMCKRARAPFMLLGATFACVLFFLCGYFVHSLMHSLLGYDDIPDYIQAPRFECDKSSEGDDFQSGMWRSRNIYAGEGRTQSESHLSALSIFVGKGSTKNTKQNHAIKSTVPAVTFAIASECTNFLLRQTIRDTWGSIAKRRGLALMFFVGRNIEKCEPRKIGEEYEHHMDVVQLEIPETYDNLSRKTRGIFSYIRHHMAPSGFVAKLDDDVYVDVDALIGRLANATRTFAKGIRGEKNTNTLVDIFKLPKTSLLMYIGFLHTSSPVIRVPGCKWYDPDYPIGTGPDSTMSIFEPKTDDGADSYPLYAGGMFYLLSTALVHHLDTYKPGKGFLGKKQYATSLTHESNHDRKQLGIGALPVWANEDATVGTWVYSSDRHALQHQNEVIYVHEPSILPSRISKTSIHHAPIAIHMDWATGQHIRKSAKPSHRQQLNRRLLKVAHRNLKRNGLSFGECIDKSHSASLRGPRKASQDGSLKPTSLISQRDAGVQKDAILEISEREHRHGLLTASLYRRPDGLTQAGNADAMDALCHHHTK